MNEIIIKTEHNDIATYLFELFEALAINDATNVTFNISQLLGAVSNKELEINISIEDNNLTIINI